jgi:hypothetical protein
MSDFIIWHQPLKVYHYRLYLFLNYFKQTYLYEKN